MRYVTILSTSSLLKITVSVSIGDTCVTIEEPMVFNEELARHQKIIQRAQGSSLWAGR